MKSRSGFERRASVRVWFDAPTSAELLPQSPPPHVWSLLGEDLSPTGIRLLSPRLFPVGSRLRLDIDVEGGGPPIPALGRVVWVEQLPEIDRWRVGLEFADLSESARGRILDIVRHQRRPA